MTRRTTRTTIALVLVAATLALPAAAENAAGKRLLGMDDYGAVKWPASPVISPDGRQVAFTLDERLYLVSDDPRNPRALTSAAHDAEGARWSADGDSIYFLSERDAGRQIYRLPVDAAGEAVQMTHFEHGVASLDLSPDETRVLLVFSEDDVREEPESPQPIVITRLHFKRDAGDGYITGGTLNHLYVYDIASREVKRLTSGPYEERDAAWSPDGRRIVFTSNRQDPPDRDYRSDLFIVDAEAGEEKLLRLTDDAHTKSRPAWSPDGRDIAYLTAEDGVYAIPRLAVIPAAGGEPKILTAAFDRSIASFEYSPDGKWIYFHYPDRGSVALARVRVRDGRIETLLDGERVVGAFDVGASGDIVFLAHQGTGSDDVYRLQGGSAVRLTDLNREFFDGVALGQKSRVAVESSGDTVVDSFITTPPGYEGGRTYPAVLVVHGGPVDQFTWGYGFGSQYLASRGYVVIEPNPRGSSGRGQAFVREIYQAWGLPDYDDLMAVVDYAVSEGIADPERLFVTGYSYGGYMTNVIITRTERFRAAVSGAGHALIEANFGHDIYSPWYLWEFGVPWENRALYELHSPLLRAAAVTTPTLFYCGRVDWNVPLLNSELFYQALQVRGVDSELVVYPGAHHGGWSDEFEKDALARTIQWFERFGSGVAEQTRQETAAHDQR